MSRIVNRMVSRLDGNETEAKKVGSFVEFLLNHARARKSGGFTRYSFKGREPIRIVAERIDEILGDGERAPVPDASICVAGGVQFGKTLLVLYLIAYLTAVRFLNVLAYLPDRDLADGIVDAKFRPEVLDQVPWLSNRIAVGKTLNASGKSVNRKGAFMATGPNGMGLGMFLGLGTLPKAFSADVTMIDERDDAHGARAKATTGRMTSSDIRLQISIGSQRFAGTGQNKVWKEGSQGVFVFGSRDLAPEEHWPAVCRLQVGKRPSKRDPKLTYAGDFARDAKGGDVERFAFDGKGKYYLADPRTGERFDRDKPRELHRRPDRAAREEWSWRICQLSLSAISLPQVLRRWQKAITDPEELELFNFEVLANPQNESQKITPEIITRAQETAPFVMTPRIADGCRGFAGLDMGSACWFTAREVESAGVKRLRYAEKIPSANVVDRAVSLYYEMQLSGLLVDAAPLLNEARAITYAIHGLTHFEFPRLRDPENSTIVFPGNLRWLGDEGRWSGLRAAVVEFTKRKQGEGITHKLGIEDTNDGPRFYPVIECNRYETIERVINELLTERENVIDVVDGQPRQAPALLLPKDGNPTVETLGNHLMAGSLREENPDGSTGDFVKKAENHFLLSAAYGRLAELCIAGSKPRPFAYERVSRNELPSRARARGRQTIACC